MRRFLQKYTIWILVALFALSAGHGFLFHTDHGPKDCALGVLAWTIAIASTAVLAIATSQQHGWSDHRRSMIPTRVLVYTDGQRAPPIHLLP